MPKERVYDADKMEWKEIEVPSDTPITDKIDRISKGLMIIGVAILFYFLFIQERETIPIYFLPFLLIGGAGQIFKNTQIELRLKSPLLSDKITAFAFLLVCIFH